MSDARAGIDQTKNYCRKAYLFWQYIAFIKADNFLIVLPHDMC